MRAPGAWARVLVPALLAMSCAPRYPVDGERALERVRHQVAAGPRLPGSDAHATVLRWMESEMRRLGGRAEVQSATDSLDGRPLPLRNLIAHFGPDDAPRIALCAHWDTRPWSDQDADSAHRNDPVPGANDGASGVAVLMEVAELMRTRPPRIGVDLVFLDGEDQGRSTHPEDYCLGARAYARMAAALPAPRRPVAAFVFDMVGDKDLGIWPEVESVNRASNLVDLVLEGARQTGATHFHREPRYTLTDDHIRLLDAGIPAVDIIDFDYVAWHTHLDLPDQVSAASLAEVSRVAAWLVYRGPFGR